MSADIRYRSARMAGAIAARVPDDELEVPAIDLDGLKRNPESLRARYRTADLSPHSVIDNFLLPTARERTVKRSSGFRPSPIRRGPTAS